MCLKWRKTLDREAYVADLEARVLATVKSMSSEIQTALRKCLQDNESDFIGKVDARCAVEGTLQESELLELSTEEWAFPCVDEAIGE
jgi:F420-dependent methylenetetrahydromethanopterin dehydrogenase